MDSSCWPDGRLGSVAKLCGTSQDMKLTHPNINLHAIHAKFAFLFASAQPWDGAHNCEGMFDGGALDYS